MTGKLCAFGVLKVAENLLFPVGLLCFTMEVGSPVALARLRRQQLDEQWWSLKGGGGAVGVGDDVWG